MILTMKIPILLGLPFIVLISQAEDSQPFAPAPFRLEAPPRSADAASLWDLQTTPRFSPKSYVIYVNGGTIHFPVGPVFIDDYGPGFGPGGGPHVPGLDAPGPGYRQQRGEVSGDRCES